MTTQYFDNPTTGFKQYRGTISGAYCEWGEYSFVTTGSTVEIPTYLSKVLSATMTLKTGTGGAAITTVAESLYCDLTVTEMAVTVTRVAQTDESHFTIDNGQFTSYNLTATPLMVAPAARTLSQIEVYCGVAAVSTGTLTFDLEKVGTANHFISGATLSETNATTTGSAWSLANTAIADGDVLQVNTNNGTSGSVADWCISMQTTRPLTTGLIFNYFFIGLP